MWLFSTRLKRTLAFGPGDESALPVDTGSIVLRNSHKVIESLHEWYRCFSGNRSYIAVQPPLSEQKVSRAFVMPKLLLTEWIGVQCDDVDVHAAS